MFLVSGRTERSSYGMGVATAAEALAKRSELVGLQMTVVVLDVTGNVMQFARLQELAEAEALVDQLPDEKKNTQRRAGREGDRTDMRIVEAIPSPRGQA